MHTSANMQDKKAAKKLLKRAKKHPDWYTEKDIYYAKMIRKEDCWRYGSRVNNFTYRYFTLNYAT